MNEEASRRITKFPAVLAESKARGKNVDVQTSMCPAPYSSDSESQGGKRRAVEGTLKRPSFETTPITVLMPVVLKLCALSLEDNEGYLRFEGYEVSLSSKYLRVGILDYQLSSQ